LEVVNWARKIKGNKKDWQAFLDGTSTTEAPSTTTDYATTTIPVSTSIITTVTTSMPATARNPKFNTNTGLDRNSANRKTMHNSASKPGWAEKLIKPETRPLLERPVENQRAEVNEYDDYSAKPILPGTVAMAVKEVTEPERTNLPIDEPIVVQSEDKSAITFYPSLLKETFNQLPGLSKLEVTKLLSKFLSEYKEIIHDDVATTEEPVKTTTEIYTTDFTSTMTTNGNVNPFRGCPNLIPPEDGFLQYSDGLNSGSVVTYICSKGFEIKQKGAERKCICEDNGCVWSKKPRDCERKVGGGTGISTSEREMRREEKRKQRIEQREREKIAKESFSRKTKKTNAKKQASRPSSTAYARSLGGASVDTSGQFFNSLFVEKEDFYQEQAYHHTPTSEESKMPSSARSTNVVDTTCDPLILEHGQIFCSNHYNDGSKCTLSCLRGFNLQFTGRVVRCVCTQAGCHWNKPPQKCV